MAGECPAATVEYKLNPTQKYRIRARALKNPDHVGERRIIAKLEGPACIRHINNALQVIQGSCNFTKRI